MAVSIVNHEYNDFDLHSIFVQLVACSNTYIASIFDHRVFAGASSFHMVTQFESCKQTSDRPNFTLVAGKLYRRGGESCCFLCSGRAAPLHSRAELAQVAQSGTFSFPLYPELCRATLALIAHSFVYILPRLG